MKKCPPYRSKLDACEFSKIPHFNEFDIIEMFRQRQGYNVWGVREWEETTVP